MNITKIKQYSLKELIIIAFYKIFYNVFLKIEYLFNNGRYITKQKWNTANYQITSFSEFFNKSKKTDKNKIINEANEILNGNITVFGKKVSFNYEKDWLKDPCSKHFWYSEVFFSKAKTVQKGLGDVKYVLEVNKLNHLVNVALAYYHTSDSRYIEYINKSIHGFIHCVPYEKSVVNRIIMDLAFRSINLIQISLLCWQNTDFKKKTLPTILSLLYGLERQMRKFSSPRWFKTGNGVNHNTGEMVGLIITQLWLSQFQEKNYKKHIKTEFKYLHEVLDRTIAHSGAYLEQSANYACVVLEFLIIFEIFIKEFIPNQIETTTYLSKKYKERLMSYLNDLYSAEKLPNFGDNDNARVLWAFINNLNDYSYLGLSKNEVITNVPSIITKYLDGSQWIFKSHDKNDIWLFTRVGKFAYLKEGVGAHVHNDLLAILLTIKGQEVFIDRGTSFYNSGEKYKTSDKKTASHNTISIKGIEMADILSAGYKNYPLSKILDDCNYIFSAHVTYKKILHKRKMQYLNNNIIVIDEINSDDNYVEGNLNYLLAEDILIEKKSKNCAYLFNKSNKISLTIKIEGVESFKIVDAIYYPQYGEKHSTKSIQCSFNYEKEKQLITRIELS